MRIFFCHSFFSANCISLMRLIPPSLNIFFSLKMWNPAINSFSWAGNPRVFLTEKSVLREQMCCLTGRSTDETRVRGIWRGREKKHMCTHLRISEIQTYTQEYMCVLTSMCEKREYCSYMNTGFKATSKFKKLCYWPASLLLVMLCLARKRKQ